MFFYKFKKEGVQKQAELISAILQWRIIIGVLSILITALISTKLNNIFFQGELSFIYFGLAIAHSFYTNNESICRNNATNV